MRRPQRLFLVLMILLGAMSLAPAPAATYTKHVDNGPSSNRVDLVFFGDGYTADEIETSYRSHITGVLNRMFQVAPYSRYGSFFNVHIIDVVSNESGADVPAEDVFRDTALDASYGFGGAATRVLFIDPVKANVARREATRDAPFLADIQLVTVNSSRHGGGSAAKYSVFPGGSGTAADVALHEIGHSFAGLADEYGGGGHYDGPERVRPNVTTSPDGAKWAHWIGYEEPGMGVIGAYEGGDRYDTGIYRPSVNSRMRTHTRPFDAVSREEIVLDIYDFVDPLDDWLDNSTVLANPESLWVDVVDPEVIQVDWYVDGALMFENAGEQLSIANLELDPGTYEVSALARDPTDWVRIKRDRLEQLTTWEIVRTPPVSGDFTGDGLLTSADIDLLTVAVWEPSDVTLFDLDGNQNVDHHDRQVWVEELAGTSFGDSNLDGRFNSTDLVGVFQQGQYEDDMPLNSTWSTGDWDGDRDFTTGDMVLAFQSGGYTVDAMIWSTSVVPEPSSVGLLIIGCWAIGFCNRGRNRACRRPPHDAPRS